MDIATIKDRWLGAGFQRYLKNTGWLFGARVASMGISFIATAIVARHLGPNNYGELSYAVSFVALFSFISSFGIDPVLYRDLVKYPDLKKEILGSGFFIKLCAGVAAALLTIIFAMFYSTDDVSKILIFILSGTFIFNSFLVVNNEFQARVQSKYPAIISVIVILILNALKIGVIMFDKGVIYLALVLLSESVLNASLYWFLYKNKLGGNVREWKFSGSIVRSLFKDSWPLIFSAAFALIYARIDQIFIKHMINAEAVGVYDAAVRVAETWYFLPSIIIASLFPAIVNAKTVSQDMYRFRLKKFAILIFSTTVGIAIVNTLLAPYIIDILYGSAFAGGVIILQIYVWTVIAISLGSLASSHLLIENNRKTLFFITLIPMICNVALNLWWIPKYGIVGSAYATLISYFLGPLSLLLFRQSRAEILILFNFKTAPAAIK